MINQTAYAKLKDLTEALHDCGWSVTRCEKFSSDTLSVMLAIDRGAERDRKSVEAAKLLPKVGPDVAADRLGTCRSNVYKLVHHYNDKVYASGQA